MKTMILSDEQRAAYAEQGYLVLPGVFTAAEVDEMRAASDELLEQLLNASLALGERSPRLDLQRRDGITVVRKAQPVVDLSEVFARSAADERLIGPLREILGSEPLLMEEKFNPKQALSVELPIESADAGEAFQPHTDWAYFRAQGYPRETLSSAISIDASTPDNGPISVLPGSHLREYPEREGYPPVLVDGAISDEELVGVLAPPGSVMIFHSALVHSSSENRSGAPRRIMIFSHYPSTHAGDPDRRNAPIRERARAHEERYRALLEDGYRPTFTIG